MAYGMHKCGEGFHRLVVVDFQMSCSFRELRVDYLPGLMVPVALSSVFRNVDYHTNRNDLLALFTDLIISVRVIKNSLRRRE